MGRTHDRRMTPANDRAALDTLRGQIGAARFVPGEAARITVALADLLVAPGGARDRQVLWGDQVLIIDRHAGWAFVQMQKDGFCGYLPESALGPPEAATHWVTSGGTHLYDGPKVQHEALAALPMGARLRVLSQADGWAKTPQGFVPAMHLQPLGQFHDDPASVAQRFLHTPYLWGGNSRAGIDCSGLVQGAFLACGIALPGDSDLQQACGDEIPTGAPLRRNDLLFWRGHVALALAPDRLIHATAAFMAVVEEDTATVIARIAAAGAGPVLTRRRLSPAPSSQSPAVPGR